MSFFSQNLYITYSNQKARDIRANHDVGVFDKVITLENLIVELYANSHFEYYIDSTIATAIIYTIIQEHKIEYFTYLQNDALSLNTIYNFIIKCHRNDVAFKDLLSDKKLDAILKIDAYYQEYKKRHNIVDIADIEICIANTFSLDLLKGYESVYIDEFKVGNINFIKSKKQEQIFEKLMACKRLSSLFETNDQSCKLITTSHEVFDNIDEVKTAIRVSRKLLENGENADDILIVASDIAEYAPLYKLFLDEYGMKGYSSIGTPLSHFFNSKEQRVIQAFTQYKNHVATLGRLFNNLGLVLTDTLKDTIKASITILDEKIGIELTEPNQIVGLSKKYKHIIFIGTDINHFPPATSENFLYSYEDDTQYFYANNYFTSSLTQYDELKRLSENLYLITASHSGKRELSRSIVVDSHYDATIDIDDVLSINDLALANKTVLRDATQKEYYQSLIAQEFTKFDGMYVRGSTATHLSASQINKYLSCPLAYFYTNKLQVKPPKRDEEGFDAMEQGSLMHLCYELFGREIKDKAITSLDHKKLYELMYEKSLQAFMHEDTKKSLDIYNIHHKIFLSNLQAGLLDERDKGLLAKFVDYYIQHAKEFSYFQKSEFEKEFALDSELKPYKLTSTEDRNYFIKGFIDRFDNLEAHINIIDYKSKKLTTNIDKDKQKQVATLKDVQLALYILYASQEYPNKDYYAHLLSFKGDKPYYHFANLATKELKDTVHYSDKYAQSLKQLIVDTKANIEAGNFAFNNADETACGYCDLKHMCHESVLSKNIIREDER